MLLKQTYTHNRQAGGEQETLYSIWRSQKTQEEPENPEKTMLIQAESGQNTIFQPNIPSSALTGELSGVDVGLGSLGSSTDSACCSGSVKKKK